MLSYTLLLTICAVIGWRYLPQNLTVKCMALQSFHYLCTLALGALTKFKSSSSPRFFIPWHGNLVLAPKLFIEGMSDKNYLNAETQIQGPSMQYPGIIPNNFDPTCDHDLVPALICLQPFPCIKQYLMWEWSTLWPSAKALAQMADIPGVLVPTGRKGSPNTDIEWRYSFSVQEICRSQEMPGWVKAGYRAFKYTLKHMSHVLRVAMVPTDEEVLYQDISVKQLIDRMMSEYTKYRDGLQLQKSNLQCDIDDDLQKEGESRVCSYHMKTILMWSLEDPYTWKEQSPFWLMLCLLRNMERHLRYGSLPHYFSDDCDLFANVSLNELALTCACVVEILRNPVAVMCHTAVKPTSATDLLDCQISRQKQMIIRRKKAVLIRFLFVFVGAGIDGTFWYQNSLFVFSSVQTIYFWEK